MDAFIAYCVVRHFQPRLIVKVGSGFSSLILGEALARNGGSSLICVEPYPQDFPQEGFPGRLEAEFDQHVQYSYNEGGKDNDVQQLIAKLQKECELVNSSLSSGKVMEGRNW